MIGQVMREINKYFPRTYENTVVEFDAEEKTITGAFSRSYLPGQYIMIQGSTLNDGVCKIVSVDDGEITVDGDIYNETTQADIFGLAPPRDFLQLVNEIAAYQSKDGVASESIDDYSVSFSDGDGSWRSVFRKRLNAYRSIYSDLEAMKHGNSRLLLHDNKAY